MRFKYSLALLSAAILTFTGCGNGQGALVEDYLEYVADRDIDGITDSVSVEDAKDINERISRCIQEMSNENKKAKKIKAYLFFKGYMNKSKNGNMLDKQMKLKRQGKPYSKKYPEPDELIEIITKNMPEEGKELLEVIKDFGEDPSKNKSSYNEMFITWYEEHYTDKSFCEMQTVRELNYDEINILEVKEESADRVNVRYEIVADDGSSDKNSIRVEKIGGDWKVARRPYIRGAFGW